MGGFRFNGCGATDHFKRIKSLGTHLCPTCKQETEFFLAEAKFKIDIFFIPTVTLKSRYAVMCGRCEQGEYCSDRWASTLINRAGPAPVIFESQARALAQAVASVQSAPAVPKQNTPAAPEKSAPAVPEKSASAVSFFKCPHCGVTQLREGPFCSFCGKPVPEEPPRPVPTLNGDASGEESVCPVCGSRQKAGMKFCPNCGHPMDTQPPERVCPGCGAKIESGAAFCMECGMKL